MTTTALYAGSFDPFTIGHLDILNTGLKIFDKVIIGIAFNPEKKSFLPVETRVELIKQTIKDIQNVEVYSFEGLTVDFAKKHNAKVLIRGIRTFADFEYENKMAQINSSISNDITTVLLPAKPEHLCISSSVVRELLSYKKDLSAYVPSKVAEYLYKL